MFLHYFFDLSYSVGEYELYLKEGSAFIFYGFEKFAQEFSPDKMATLNLPGSHLFNQSNP